MRLFVEVIQGPEEGQQFNLKTEASIGRRGAEIILNDPKLSGIHGIFQYHPKEGWYFQDNDSRNGVWLNGIREHRFAIKDGMIIQIGQSLLRCRIVKKSSKQAESAFLQWARDLVYKVKNKDLTLEEIKPEMRLKVIQGIQYGESWDIFYGPRTVGKEHIDIGLHEEGVPEEAFEIRVKLRYPYFFTEHPDVVKLNGEAVSDKQLIPGDIIEIGESKILVEFDDGHEFSG